MKLAFKFSVVPTVAAFLLRFLWQGMPPAAATETIYGLCLIAWLIVSAVAIFAICSCEPNPNPNPPQKNEGGW